VVEEDVDVGRRVVGGKKPAVGAGRAGGGGGGERVAGDREEREIVPKLRVALGL